LGALYFGALYFGALYFGALYFVFCDGVVFLSGTVSDDIVLSFFSVFVGAFVQISRTSDVVDNERPRSVCECDWCDQSTHIPTERQVESLKVLLDGLFLVFYFFFLLE